MAASTFEELLALLVEIITYPDEADWNQPLLTAARSRPRSTCRIALDLDGQQGIKFSEA